MKIGRKTVNDKNSLKLSRALIAKLNQEDPNWPDAAAVCQIEKQQSSSGMKSLLLSYACSNHLLNKSSEKGKSWIDRYKNRPDFISFTDSWLKEQQSIFQISGLVCVMGFTVVCGFVGFVLSGQYLINFSFSALFAAVGFAFAAVNFSNMIKTAELFGNSRQILMIWILALVLALLLKFMIPAQLDASLIIFLLALWFSRKQLIRMQNEFVKINHLRTNLLKN